MSDAFQFEVFRNVHISAICLRLGSTKGGNLWSWQDWLFSFCGITFTFGCRYKEMKCLLTSVLQEKILTVCQIHPGTFPDQVYTTAKQCIKQPHQVPHYSKSKRRKRIERWIWRHQNSDWLQSSSNFFSKVLGSTAFSYLASYGFS